MDPFNATNAVLKAFLEVDSDDLADVDVPTDGPLDNFFERATQDRLRKSLPGLDDLEWNAPLAPVTKAAPTAEFSNPLGFSKTSAGYRMRIDRMEEKVTADGKWMYAYSGDELVDAREIQETEE